MSDGQIITQKDSPLGDLNSVDGGGRELDEGWPLTFALAVRNGLTPTLSQGERGKRVSPLPLGEAGAGRDSGQAG